MAARLAWSPFVIYSLLAISMRFPFRSEFPIKLSAFALSPINTQRHPCLLQNPFLIDILKDLTYTWFSALSPIVAVMKGRISIIKLPITSFEFLQFGSGQSSWICFLWIFELSVFLPSDCLIILISNQISIVVSSSLVNDLTLVSNQINLPISRLQPLIL